MQESPDDKVISWVEDLDPDPPRREGLGQWRELILGLVLLLAVVGWAGWQWSVQARNESEYSLGEQAFLASDLEEAETHFSAVRDYRDAGSRADEIAKTIAERDADYSDLATSYQSGDWLRAYDAAWKLRPIVPSSDYPLSLFNGAREQIYTQALSGTVYSRMDASPPGLYYRDGDSWVWFEGSDIRSRVLGTGPRGHMVYDVPGSNRARTFNIDPSYWLDGSKLMLATFTPQRVTFEPLALDPAAFDYFVWGDNGVWGLKAGTPDSAGNPDDVRFYGMQTGYVGYHIEYEAYGSPIKSDMKAKGPAWIVLDFAPDGTEILMADVGNYSISHPLTNLYVADADGTNPRLLYSYVGNFQRAIFSPNSRYVLATLYSRFPYDTKAGQQSVILFDTVQQQPTRVLAQADRSYDSVTYYQVDTLASTFVQSGPYAGQILLVESVAGQSTTIELFDPARPERVASWTTAPDLRPTGDNWWGETANDQGLLLAFQGTNEMGAPELHFVWAQVDSAQGGKPADYAFTFREARMSLDYGESMQGAWLSARGKLVVMESRARAGASGSQGRSVTFRNAILWGLPTTPQVVTEIIYTGWDPPSNGQNTNSPGSAPPSLDSPVIAGPGMIAYGDPGSGDFGTLHVKSYDGNSAVVQLADKGYKLYNWSQYQVSRGLR